MTNFSSVSAFRNSTRSATSCSVRSVSRTNELLFGCVRPSPAFGPSIHAGLAGAGLVQGTPDYDAYFVATQTVIDSGDPINYAGNGTLVDPAARTNDSFKNILINEVVGGGDVLPDQVIPNRVAGAPLSGTEPLIAALGAQGIDDTVLLSYQGLQVVTRFLQGEHGSLLDPTDFPYATAEMQGEMASFVAYNGFAVLVNNPTILQPVPQPAADSTTDAAADE